MLSEASENCYLVRVEKTVIDAQVDELNQQIEHLLLQLDVTGTGVQLQ